MYFLLAEAAAGTGAENTQTLPPWITWVMLGLIAVVFYFFMIRPQKKKEKEEAAMRDALEVGDEVTTIGGIIGEVVSIKEETVTIETSRYGTKLRFLRNAIRSVDVRAADKRAPQPQADENKAKDAATDKEKGKK